MKVGNDVKKCIRNVIVILHWKFLLQLPLAYGNDKTEQKNA